LYFSAKKTMNLIPVITIVIIIMISLLVTKIAAAMLVNTGLSRHAARFQSRSAFTGVGFTTSESELITSHPARRKIISTLMLLGNAGIVTVMASLLLTFVHRDESHMPWYFGVIILAGGILFLAFLSSSKRVDLALTRLIDMTLARFATFNKREYSSLYTLANGYHVMDIYISPVSEHVGKAISTTSLAQHGIIILGIEEANGQYNGKPEPDTIIKANDLLIVYGLESDVTKLFSGKHFSQTLNKG